MILEPLMLELAQALGGISKHKGDFWILEIPEEDGESCVLFFRLNPVENGADDERILVFFTEISHYKKKLHANVETLEFLLRANVDLRYSRVALMGEHIVLLAVSHEDLPENVLLEKVHEVARAGIRLKKDFARMVL